MRFTSLKDYQTLLLINQELVNTVVDTPIILYKLHQQLSEVNSYGESTNKIWYSGVEIPCLYQRQPRNTTADMQNTNVEQSAEFRFLRYELEVRNVYPEQGDIIWFLNEYYEIDTINENQLWAGQDQYVLSIICGAHLTNKVPQQLEPPIV